MKKAGFIVLIVVLAVKAFAQNRFNKDELSVNGFRNPSIGVEYRYQHVPIHAGYYTTAFKSGEHKLCENRINVLVFTS